MRIEQVPAGARARLPSACARPALVRAALLASAVVISGIAPASALPQDFWADDIISFEPAPPPPRATPPRRHKTPRVRAKEIAAPARKPQRPLIVAVSINNQSLKVYDANGLFAQAPVSTGMRGHATPLGVFSVIQKNKWHRSNIYSGAPMPYMQRLTWSGIAMHAGALPGYPASHGCIRMPTRFAEQMWNWTRMGARVIVTPGEVVPVAFAHPLLATRKPDPAPAPAADATPAATVGAAQVADTAPAFVAELAELRPSVMPAAMAQVAASATTGIAAIDKPTQVADAGDAIGKPETPAATPAVMVDGPPAAVAPPPPKRTGPISVFISRKDGRLYARQNFEPIFDVPVTIADGDRPLGTHVFTAQADGDAATFRWTALTLPSPAKSKIAKPRRHAAATVATDPEPSAEDAAAALDRITVAPETMTRIAEALSTGSSIIVSDQGLAAGGETGQGTEFIIPLR